MMIFSLLSFRGNEVTEKSRKAFLYSNLFENRSLARVYPKQSRRTRDDKEVAI